MSGVGVRALCLAALLLGAWLEVRSIAVAAAPATYGTACGGVGCTYDCCDAGRAALPLGAELVPRTASDNVTINAGWNAVDLPLQTGIASASALAAKMDASKLGDGAVQAVATYTNGALHLFVPGFSSDVPLQPWQGILVLSRTAGTWVVSGTPYAAGVSVPLRPGWNLIAAPFPAQGLATDAVADEASACAPREVAVLRSGAYRTWLWSEAEFGVSAMEGMWVLCGAGPVTWTPRVRVAAPLTCTTCWHPALDTSWQWQLTTPVDQSVSASMYDIDMFDNDSSVVSSLHGAGRTVICYINAGAWENWRPDASSFPASVIGKALDGWPGEFWFDIRRLSTLAPLLEHRMDLCKTKGFDGVEFDNVDGYANPTGFPLTYADQIAFNTFLANAAHSRGLSVALKNDLDQIPDLLPYFDWELDEECFVYSECDALTPFVNAGKAVMEVEYTDDNMTTGQFCPQANELNFNSLLKDRDLDAFREACR